MKYFIAGTFSGIMGMVLSLVWFTLGGVFGYSVGLKERKEKQ